MAWMPLTLWTRDTMDCCCCWSDGAARLQRNTEHDGDRAVQRQPREIPKMTQLTLWTMDDSAL
jgi:hypothetical protein